MKNKKIGIVYSGAKYQGGVEVYLDNLFSEYDRKKAELILISLGEWPLSEKIGGKIVILSKERIRPKTFFDIKKAVKNENIDLLVSQGVVANFYARIAAFLSNVPHLATIHDDIDTVYPNSFIRFLYKASDALLKWKTKRYIVVSLFLKKRMIEKGVKGEKIKVIYNGVKPFNIKKEKRKEIIIGSVGRLHYVKGYHNLIEAVSGLKKTDAKLVIWGEGSERESLEKQIRESNLQDRVELSGYENDISQIFSKIDIYVQPSISEGFGLSVVEAMLAGKPVVVTPVGALKEIIEDEETGFVAKSTKPGSILKAIEKVFDNHNLTGRIIEKAEKEAKEKYSTKRFAKETIEAYLETIK